VTGVVVPDTGHWLYEERPVELTKILLQFLQPGRGGIVTHRGRHGVPRCHVRDIAQDQRSRRPDTKQAPIASADCSGLLTYGCRKSCHLRDQRGSLSPVIDTDELIRRNAELPDGRLTPSSGGTQIPRPHDNRETSNGSIMRR
jgi:hypothetical protein